MKKQRWEESEKRTKEERRSEKRKRQKTEDAGAWKDSKVTKHCVFPVICCSGGSKSRLAKAPGAEPAGQMSDEKIAHRCGVKPGSEHFWKLRSWGKCTPLWREAHFEVKMYKAHHARSTFWKLRWWKRTPLWREAHVQVNMLAHARTTVEGSDVILLGKRKGFCTLPKVRKREDFVAVSKTMAGVGHFKRFYKDAFRVAGAVQETCSSEMLGGQGRDFLRGVALWSIRSSGCKIILRDGCSTSYDLASPFPGRRNTLDRWNGKIAKRIGTRRSALHLTLHFWRTSGVNHGEPRGGSTAGFDWGCMWLL